MCLCVCVCMPVSMCGDGDGGKAFGSHSLISMWPLPGGESSLLARCVRCLCVRVCVSVLYVCFVCVCKS